MIIDKKYLPGLQKDVPFTTKNSYIQLATVEEQHGKLIPKLRSVLLYFDEEKNYFYFSCSNKTAKWEQLSKNPIVSAVFLDHGTTKQYRFEATAKLVTVESEPDFMQKIWQALRLDLREPLWQECNDEKKEIDIEQMSPLHGVVILQPYYSDIFHLNKNDFAKSERVQMTLHDNTWHVKENLSPLHPLPITELIQ
jgi:general stress protein 26